MNILYIGDIMGDKGIEIVESVLPNLKSQHSIDLVIAQAENVSDGKSMKVADMRQLQNIGVDFFTGGNHTPKRSELHDLLKDQNEPVIGPANMPVCPGPGWKFIDTPKGRVLVISILGQTVGMKVESTNPLQKIDEILAKTSDVPVAARVVNIHGDYSSEKVVFGQYVDSRVSMVIGDHWHVPTADEMILPGNTAFQSDVGMCGVLHASLGVKTQVIIDRWRDDKKNSNALEESGDLQFNALLVSVDESTQLAKSIKRIRVLEAQ